MAPSVIFSRPFRVAFRITSFRSKCLTKTNMAEGGVTASVRKEWHKLLVALKSTAEGLLAAHSSNVWNIYGGLNRIHNDMDHIMNHRLKVIQSPRGSCLDFWNFVRGLSWLNPTMAPTIEQFHKMTRGGGTSRSPSRRSPGRVWLRQSLLEHSLSAQLAVLTGNREYLLQHYEADAFLCQPCYLHAMLQCLQAVEQNRAALLADINIVLLSQSSNRRRLPNQFGPPTSCPGSVCRPDEMIRSRNLPDGHLVPLPVKPCQTSSVLAVNEHEAIPIGLSIYREESATEALRNVLNRSGNVWDDNDEIDIGIDCEVLNDPLMNMQIIPVGGASIPKKSASFSALSNYSKLHRHPGIRKSRSRTAVLLDQILNDDSEVLTKSYANKDSTAKSCEVPVAPDVTVVQDQRRFSEPINDGALIQILEPSDGLDSKNPDPQNSNHNGAVPSTTLGASTKHFTHKRSTSDFGIGTQSKCHSTEKTLGNRSPLSLSSSLPNGTQEDAGTRRHLKDGVFLQPAEGQSLRSFLSSQDFHTCAELDKENAHFTLAEGLIAAIEQMKWNQIIRPQRDSDHEEGDSDEEIQQLKQRIRIRRRERLKEKAEDFPTFFVDKSDAISPTVTPSGTPLSSSPSFSSISQESNTSSVEFHDADIAEADGSDIQSSNLTNLSNSGLSLSMASLYSDVEIQKSNAKLEKDIERQTQINENSTSVLLSAESVAISLLSRFSEKQLPKASELEWLVSEQDAPQQLLPLPDSYPVSPDDGEQSDLTKCAGRTRIRGNLEWAPPRPQIIFNIHPPPRRKVILARQNYRCAGCGAKVEPGYTRRYHYCEYLGKYFCPCCHGNDVAYIPSRILRRWDFTKYYVSNFARDFLQRIYKDPLFNIMDINEGLYRKARQLEAAADCRRQLRHLVPFLKTCRFGGREHERLEKLPTHWTSDIHLYSIAELVEIKKNEHLNKLTPLIKECITHISHCPLCQAKGFICEVCRNMNDVIFPFELNKVVQCPACKTCFHKQCYQPESCPKCARIEARRQCLEKDLTSDEDESPTTTEDKLTEAEQMARR